MNEDPDTIPGPDAIPILLSPPRTRAAPDDPLFDEFWTIYPRKIGKAGAGRAWQRVTRHGGDPSAIIAAATLFARECSDAGTATKYIPHPARWLRDGRYADEAAGGERAEPAVAADDGKSYRLHPGFPAWPTTWGPPDGEPDSWVWTKRPLSLTPDGELLCPHCGDPTIEGGEGADVFAHPDQDGYEPGNPLETRGGYTIITMTCACGLRLALASANHKGMFCLQLFAVTAAGPSFDSPVERMFWQACRDAWPPHLSDLLAPQYPVNVRGRQFYLDFALMDGVAPGPRVGFEIDGHATHSSPQAIAADRQRQRMLEEAGWRIIRFGGREVHHDARRCATEALRHVRAQRPESAPDQKEAQ